jgi:hypothetical protein
VGGSRFLTPAAIPRCFWISFVLRFFFASPRSSSLPLGLSQTTSLGDRAFWVGRGFPEIPQGWKRKGQIGDTWAFSKSNSGFGEMPLPLLYSTRVSAVFFLFFQIFCNQDDKSLNPEQIRGRESLFPDSLAEPRNRGHSPGTGGATASQMYSRDGLDSPDESRLWYHSSMKPRESLQVDPASLHLPGRRVADGGRQTMRSTERIRDELLAALSQLGRLRPAWRLGQTLANLARPPGDWILPACGTWRMKRR